MKIEQNKSLQPLNTFGIVSTAKYFVEIGSIEAFRVLREDKRFSGEKQLILGGGSNILLTGDFDGMVVKNSIPGIVVTSETETEVIVKAGAGVVWHDLVMWCVERNYAGLENLVLIPGLTGAAPVQNIGAYGTEVRDAFYELEAIEIRSGKGMKLCHNDCAFGYRDSIFKRELKGQCFISSVSFKLVKLAAAGASYQFRTEYGDVRAMLDQMEVRDLSLKAVSEAICRIRQMKLPDSEELGNAGSFFKNPEISKEQFAGLVPRYPSMPHYAQKDGTVKVPAAWLIEQCGWKGKANGRVGMHKSQALVLVNYGGATGKEILEFSGAVQKSVCEKFGIDLLLEVNII